MKRCKTRRVTRCRFLELSSDLICDILTRLTVEVIFSCKCVCKTFLEILTGPCFVNLHLTKAPDIDNCLIIQHRLRISDSLLIYKKRLDNTYYDDSHPCQTLGMPAIVSQNYKDSTVNIVGSCNGLVCLSYRNWKSSTIIYYICNPILGEFFAVPPYTESKRHRQNCAFGFCSKTKQYKVIKFFPSITEIYTLGSGSWREIGHVPKPPEYLSFCGCSLNGNLYWVTHSSKMSNLICSFNLEIEHFSYLSTPPQFDYNASKNFNYIDIGLLDRLLCFYYCFGSRFEAFVMNDYGANGGWTKELSIDLSTTFIPRNSSCRVLNFLENGELILTTNVCNFISCNLRKGTAQRMLTNEARCVDVMSFVPSFVSLKDIIADEVASGHVEVVQRRMGRNHWSENGFRFFD